MTVSTMHVLRCLTLCLCLGVLAWFATPVAAQAITTWTINLYQGTEGSTLLRTQTIPATTATCNVDPASVQPDKSARWDDPAVAGRKCQWQDTTFFTLQTGNYQGGIRAGNSAGLGPESVRYPFSVAAPPLTPPTLVPTGLVVKP